MNEADRARLLVDTLMQTDVFPHPVDDLACIETHISWVILAGPYAYKIKKPLDLGFLDYSTLERRRTACEDELRLNARTAPELYVDVVTIGGTAAHPRINGSGDVLEYAVRMHRFDQRQLFGDMLKDGTLASEAMDRVAQHVAGFHDAAAVAPPDGEFGTAEAVWLPVRQNFEQIRERVVDSDLLKTLVAVEIWSERQFERLRTDFDQRLADGWVRECHGDLHLGNLVMLDGEPRLFDGIEFNPALRWTDVMADAAFLAMDLEARGRPELAHRFVNVYVERTGDYAGLRLLTFYVAYRAMVRAKVTAIRMGQSEGAERDRCVGELRRYLALADNCARERQPCVLIANGVSGSGKSRHALALVERRGAIRVRSDVERKRLFGLKPNERGNDIYTETATRHTYTRLAALATVVVEAGYPVLVDATFLKRSLRDDFAALARGLGVACIILAFDAPVAVLRERVRRRAAAGKDASDADVAVLEAQLAEREPLTEDERARTLTVSSDPDWNDLLVRLDALLAAAEEAV